MKGLAIIAYQKSPGAFVEREFPLGLTAKLQFSPIDVMNLYALIRTNKMTTNFMFVTLKGIPITAFYSGFDSRHYIGRPDYIIAVFLDKGEDPFILENPLRQLCRDLLPHREEEMFPVIFEQAFFNLQEGKIRGIGPESEVKQPDAYQRSKISERDTREVIPPVLKPGLEGEIGRVDVPQVAQKDVSQLLAKNLEDINAQFKSMELEEFKNHIKQLEENLKQKEALVLSLKEKIATQGECVTPAEISEQMSKLRAEYDVILTQKDAEVADWKQKLAEMNERAHIAEASITSMNDIVLQTQSELQEQARTIGTLKKQIETLNTSKNFQVSAVDTKKFEAEISSLQDKLKSSEEEIRNRDARVEELKHEIVELKMQVKIQRREIQTLQKTAQK